MGFVWAVLSLLAVNALLGAHAVQFEVSARTTKCIAEEIQSHVVVVGDYKIVHSDEAHKVTVKVTSPYGNQLHYQENVQSGQFAFTTSEVGNFMACFWILNAPPTTVINVALDWKTGVAAKDWASIAKKDKLDGMELELRKLEETVDSIHSEMLYLREREAEMRDLNEVTNSRVAWFGIMSLLVCLAVAGWQLWHLKTFFERKKAPVGKLLASRLSASCSIFLDESLYFHFEVLMNMFSVWNCLNSRVKLFLVVLAVNSWTLEESTYTRHQSS